MGAVDRREEPSLGGLRQVELRIVDGKKLIGRVLVR